MKKFNFNNSWITMDFLITHSINNMDEQGGDRVKNDQEIVVRFQTFSRNLGIFV
mgnify:CR=1 FL=1